MSDLISRAKVFDVISNWNDNESDIETLAFLISDIPTEEPRRGKWIKNKGRIGWHCSKCKVDNFYAYVWNSETGKDDFQDRYCPSCGAEMERRSE